MIRQLMEKIDLGDWVWMVEGDSYVGQPVDDLVSTVSRQHVTLSPIDGWEVIGVAFGYHPHTAEHGIFTQFRVGGSEPQRIVYNRLGVPWLYEDVLRADQDDVRRFVRTMLDRARKGDACRPSER